MHVSMLAAGLLWLQADVPEVGVDVGVQALCLRRGRLEQGRPMQQDRPQGVWAPSKPWQRPDCCLVPTAAYSSCRNSNSCHRAHKSRQQSTASGTGSTMDVGVLVHGAVAPESLETELAVLSTSPVQLAKWCTAHRRVPVTTSNHDRRRLNVPAAVVQLAVGIVTVQHGTADPRDQLLPLPTLAALGGYSKCLDLCCCSDLPDRQSAPGP